MLGKAAQRRVFSSRLHHRGLPMTPSLQPFLRVLRAPSYLYPNVSPLWTPQSQLTQAGVFSLPS